MQDLQQKRDGFWVTLARNKKWWLTPIILAVLLVAAFVFFASKQDAMPRKYTIGSP